MPCFPALPLDLLSPTETAVRFTRLSCRDQEGRRGSEEAVPGPSVFPSGDPEVSGDFWGSQEGCQGPFRPSGRNRGLPLRRRGGQGPHLAKRWEPRGFSRVAATREESGVLGFPSRRGLTPRGSLECNPEIPAFPGEENYNSHSQDLSQWAS